MTHSSYDSDADIPLSNLIRGTRRSASSLCISAHFRLNSSSFSKACLDWNCFRQDRLHLPPHLFWRNCRQISVSRKRSLYVGPGLNRRFLFLFKRSSGSGKSWLSSSESVNCVIGAKTSPPRASMTLQHHHHISRAIIPLQFSNHLPVLRKTFQFARVCPAFQFVWD